MGNINQQAAKPFRLLNAKAGKFAKELEVWLKENLPEGGWAADWVGYGISLGRLIVSSGPSEAEVYVDDRFRGITRREREDEPAKLEFWLGKGYHRVELFKEGFGSRSRSIYLKACETEELEFWLERPGRIQIESRPSGAAIYIDGRYWGETPQEVELEPGDHLVALHKSGYRGWSRKVHLSAGAREEVYPKLSVNLHPWAKFEMESPQPLIGQEVLFDASDSYDPDGRISHYEWDFDGDGKADAAGPEVSWKFAHFGRHEVTLTVTDEDGGSDSATQAFSVRARPAAEFSFSPQELLVGELIRFDASASHDPDGTVVSYRWDFGDGAIAKGRSAAHVYAMLGTYTVTLLVRDDDGLEARVVQSIEVVRGGVLSISSTPAEARVYLDKEYIGVTPFTTPKLAEGSYRITLKLKGYKDWSMDVRIPEQGQIAAELVPLGNLSVWSDPPDAEVYLDSHSMGKTTAQGLTLYLEGEHHLRLARCGYKAWSRDVTVRSGEAQEIRAELEPISEVSVKSDPPGAVILLDGRPAGETPAKVTIGPTIGKLTLRKEGYKPWSVYCVTEEEIHVSLRKNEPPVARISAPDKGVALEELEFSAAGSWDLDGEIGDYRWEFGDGTVATGMRVGHQYEKPGTYQVRLTVVDDDGAENSVTEEISIGSHPPLVRLTAPAQGMVGEELTFSAAGSHDPDGEIVAYRWDFGDGETATCQTASHRFNEPGSYQIKLIAVDDCGVEAAETVEVEVLTGFELSINHLQQQGLLVPRPAALELNFGQNGGGTRSLGLVVGDQLMLGGSITFTGEEVPDYYEVPPQPWEGEVYDLGPELELCALVATPFIAGVSLEGGVGISFQQQVHVATMTPASQWVQPQRAVVESNGYRGWKLHLTIFGGISLRLGEMEEEVVSLGYHIRRGWIIGIGFEF